MVKRTYYTAGLKFSSHIRRLTTACTPTLGSPMPLALSGTCLHSQALTHTQTHRTLIKEVKVGVEGGFKASVVTAE